MVLEFSGAEGVDVAESHGEGLAVELTGNSQVGGLSVEILAEIHLAVLGLGYIVQIQGRDLEHFAGTLTVRTGNEGCVDVDKVPILEKLMDGHGCQGADAKHRLEGVGAGPQMGDGAKKFHGVALGLQGIVAGGGAFHLHPGSLNFKGLLAAGGQHYVAGDDEGSTDIDFGNLLEVLNLIVIDHLNGGEIGAVVEDDEAKLLAGPTVSDPTSDLHFFVSVSFCVFEQFSDRNQFHSRGLLSYK